MKNYRTTNLLLIFLSLLLFSCSHGADKQNGANQTKTDNRTEIKWMGQWFGEGKKENLIREIASDFSFRNQNYNVKLEFPHEMLKIDSKSNVYGAYLNALTDMVNNNKWPYDLVLCDSYLYSAVANRNGDPHWGEKYLMDFSNEPWFIESQKPSLFTKTNRNQSFGGMMPGAYIEGVWNVMYVSSVVEKKVGVTAKRHDMTFDDFTSYAKAVYDYNQSHSDKITFLFLPRTATIINQLAMSLLGKDSTMNRQEGLAILEQTYSEMEKIVPYKPLEKYITSKNDKDIFPGKTFFTFNPSWISLIWQSRDPEGEKVMHPCEMPSFGDGKATCYSGLYNAVFVVPKNAKNKEGAIKLMKFICSQETAEKWEKYSKCPTGIKSKAVYSELATSEINKFSQHIKAKYNDNLKEVNLAKVLLHSDKRIEFYQSQVLRGELTTKEVMKKVKEQLAAK